MNFLFSFENLQEFYDLTLIAKRLKEQGHQVYLFSTYNLYKLDEKYISRFSVYYNKIFESINVYNNDFNSLSKFKKVKTLKKNVKLLSKIIKSNNIDIMFTGVSLSLFRYTRILNRQIQYISYIRGIIANPKDYSLSAKLYFIFRIKQLSPLYCDKIAIVSPINIQYFYNYGLKDENLIKCGPLHLDVISKNKILDNKKAIIFATAAFSHHHLKDLDKEQIEFLEELIEYWQTKLRGSYEFILRIHPRDKKGNYDYLIKKYNIKVNEDNVEDFLKTASGNKILISAVSTLNFEWEYLGGKSVFYSKENIYKTHEEFYSSLGLEPIKFADQILEYLTTSKHNLKFYQHREGNINYLVRYFISELKNEL